MADGQTVTARAQDDANGVGETVTHTLTGATEYVPSGPVLSGTPPTVGENEAGS